MSVTAHILGVILAGGRARRFFAGRGGSGDKGLADIAGASMLSRVVESFRPQVGRLILNANGDPERFRAFGLEIVPDLDAEQLGPLAGIQAALHWQARRAPGVTALATVTTDVPFLPSDLVARLAAARPSGPAIAVSGERRHPAIALWPVTLRNDIDAALARRALSLNTFALNHGASEVHFPMREAGGQRIDPFFNANTQEELAEAHRLAGHVM